MYTVYEHISPSGKAYVGITSQSVEERWRQGKGYRGCTHFWNAIQKYGWDSFEHKILYTGLTYEEANQKEKELVAEKRSNDNRFGYNLESGGDSCKRLSPETRKKQSAAASKRWENAEERERMRSAMIGRVITDEARRKMRLSKIGKYDGANNPRARPVICVETGAVFETAKSAAEWAGIKSRSGIGAVCKNKMQHSGGYSWRYVDGDV